MEIEYKILQIRIQIIIPFISSLIRYLTNMQLVKNNILQFSISQLYLSNNFIQIENQFRKLRAEISSLKQNSLMVIERLNQINPYDQIQFVEPNFQDSDINNPRQGQIKIQSQQGISKINTIDIQQTSQTIIDVKDGLDKIYNLQKNQQKKRKADSRESEVSLGRNHQLISKKQDRFKQQANQSHLKQSLNQLEVRINELQIQREDEIKKLQMIQKQCQKFGKFLGFKEGKSKCKKVENSLDPNKTCKDPQNEKKIEKRKSRLQTPQDLNNHEQDERSQQIAEENHFVSKFNKDFEQLKQYLRSKIMLFENTVEKCILEVGDMKINVNNFKQQSFSTNHKLSQLQSKQTNFETYLSQFGVDKGPLGQTKGSSNSSKPTSFYHKSKTTPSQGNLNDTVESYRNYYEDKIVQIFQEMDRIRNEYFQVVEKLNNQQQGDMVKLKRIAQKISVVTNPTEERLQKQINNIKKQNSKLKQQFNNYLSDLNTGTNETKTFVIKANENKQDWKEITQKIYKLRQELLSYVKDLQTKINNNNDMTIVIQQLEVGLNQCKILNSKKVNMCDFEKCTKRIQSRLNNFIRHICEKQGMMNDQQAMVVKQPWYCLSCDSEIKNYSGKLGKTVCNQKIQGKKVNPQLHMVRRPDTKLPTVH